MKLIALLLALILLQLSHTHTLRCLFDKTNKDLRQQSRKARPDIGLNQNMYPRGRLLTPNPIRAAMRIQLDTTNFNTTIQAGVNGASNTTTTNLDFIKKTMQVAQIFYQTRLQVGQVANILAPATCVDYSTPSNAQSSGYSNADLVIYVLYITDANLTYGATGKSCKYFPGTPTTGSPDLTLQAGRPTMGRIIFNTYNLVDRETSLTNRVFQSVTSTALHQTMHILGFDSTLYSSYLDPTVGAPYTSGPQIAGTVSASRPATNFLNTPYVLAWARNFFNCSTLTGMPLQNQDGSGLGSGSHWQRTAMYDELMTGTSLGTAKYFSGLTFALLKDSGWYTVDDTFAGTSNYGYQKGCSFVSDACYNTSFSQFCTNVTHPSTISYCASNFIGKAICSSQSGLMADGCGMFGQHSSCIDADTQPTSYDIYSYQAYGHNSFCVESDQATVGLPAILQSRCYPYVCNADNIVFTIGTYTITCLASEAGTQKTRSGLVGRLVCPDYTAFCTISRKTCANFCNQNGYCMGGICNCYTGYYGSDCNQTICANNTQYYNPVSNTCGSTCPSGYYVNVYSVSCEACQSPCSQCSGSPTNCVTCQNVGGNVQYYYNLTCYAECPPSTYALPNNTCQACDTSASTNCFNCTGSPTTCTSCQPLYYLSQPVSGNCITSCGGTGYPLQDEVNMVCVTSCPSNMIAPGNGSCVLCSGGTFYSSGSSTCVATCPTGFYPDPILIACMTCHIDCLTCDGSYPENCTSCKSTSGNPYLLLKMCWSICPKGFYANPSTGNCQVCPVQLRCTMCSYHTGNSSAYCTACQYGTFFQASTTTCDTTCLSTQYQNTWNNSCNNCDPACLTCNGPTSYSCTTCGASLYLLGNSTGGYCLTACPALGYIQVGSNCQTCDPTCSTCNGASANQCSNCSTNYYQYSGYCRYVCPNGTYPNSTTWQCLNCDSTCSYCFGGTSSSCTSCASGLYLYNFTCAASCPGGMTPNQWNVCFEPYLTLTLLTLLFLLCILS